MWDTKCLCNMYLNQKPLNLEAVCLTRKLEIHKVLGCCLRTLICLQNMKVWQRL